MKKTIRILLILIVLLCIGGVFGYFWLMHSGGRDVPSEVSSYVISEKELTDAFHSDALSAEKKFLEKAITVSGKISGVKGTEVVLGKSVVCSFSSNTFVKTDEKIIVKGRLIGYDDLMDEIRLDQCTLEN